jgi:hypothetical protein
VIEHDLRGRDQVHGHRTERGREVVEVLDFVVRAGDPAEEQLHLLAVVQRGWRHDAVLDPELESGGVGPIVVLAADVLELEVGRAEHLVPVDVAEHRLELGGVHARSERAADQAAHAGAGGDIDRDAVLFEPADHSHVCDPAGAAAAKGHADRRTARDVGRRLLRGEARVWNGRHGGGPLQGG